MRLSRLPSCVLPNPEEPDFLVENKSVPFSSPLFHEFLPFDFVYAGRRALKGDKPGTEIFRIVDGRLADSFVFASKSLKGNVIGGVYRGALFTDSQARGLGAVTFVERWKDATGKRTAPWTLSHDSTSASVNGCRGSSICISIRYFQGYGYLQKGYFNE